MGNNSNPLERTAKWSRSGRRLAVATPTKKKQLFAYIKKAARQAYRVSSKPPK